MSISKSAGFNLWSLYKKRLNKEEASWDLFKFANGLSLVFHDFGFDFKSVLVPLVLFSLSLQLSGQSLNPGLQTTTILSQ